MPSPSNTAGRILVQIFPKPEFGLPTCLNVFFVSDNEGWITSSNYPEIYHTTDGGETFEIQSTQYDCNAIYMLNENEGYAGGENGRVYHTTNGGENWIAIGSIGTTLLDISFPFDAGPSQPNWLCLWRQWNSL